MLICSRPTKKDQEQLAALAPHPALRATFSRKREKGWQSAFRGRKKAVAAGRHAPHGSRKRLAAEVTLTPSRIPPSRGLDSPPAPYNPPMKHGRFDTPAAVIRRPPPAGRLVIVAVPLCAPGIQIGRGSCWGKVGHC